jgi:hypothetical protein
MYAVPGKIRATFFLLFASATACNIGASQSVKPTRYPGNPPLPARLPVASNRCFWEVASGAAGSRAEVLAASEARVSCDDSPAPVPTVNPCNSGSPARRGCAVSSDAIQVQLDAMGKAGQRISRARERVLEILETANACRAWFQEKDSNPAATFRTLSFELDLHGDDFVLESRDIGPMDIFRSPYVARVMQGDGAFGVITLNTKGAFFSTQARVLEVRKEGGPANPRGTRLLRVGPYDGDTLPARVITLLHEFGHVLDLLPTDQDNVDGKSVENTNKVLRLCGAEVDAPARRGFLSAGHR